MIIVPCGDWRKGHVCGNENNKIIGCKIITRLARRIGSM